LGILLNHAQPCEELVDIGTARGGGIFVLDDLVHRDGFLGLAHVLIQVSAAEKIFRGKEFILIEVSPRFLIFFRGFFPSYPVPTRHLPAGHRHASADSIDGMSPEAVHEAVARAVKRARQGDGPTLLEIKTYRYKGHSISDPQKYRTKEEVDEYKQRDPIQTVLQTILTKKYATQEEIDAINKRVNDTVVESVKFAEESPWPDDSEVLKDVYIDANYPFIVD